MGRYQHSIVLVEGMTLFDVDTKSIGILIRRISTRQLHETDYNEQYVIPYECSYGYEYDMYVAWLWDSLWSKDGRVIYSEDGLKNLIKAGIIIILDEDNNLTSSVRAL
tara:strand:- start:6 stop:329 length:324 start_codon:yes stop_codon:yes gene_type:complete